ncbi:MAG: hypothetical protein HDR00_12920 [Lachnospiraceae bacterium]|nr:hypothetical protein [Lachnospiraceae bacterium]
MEKYKKPFIFAIKFVLLILISYLILQLSVEAKEIGERRNIPGLQTTMEFSGRYLREIYTEDWRELGGKLVYPNALAPSCYLKFSLDDGTLMMISSGSDGMIHQMGITKGENNGINIDFFYTGNFLQVTGYDGLGNFTSYHIEYQNGKYIQNFQMEQETGFTTDEVLEQVDKLRNVFEEKMEEMHQYQIGRAKERRKKFIHFMFIVFCVFLLVYLYLKRISINVWADMQNKYREEVMKETIAKTKAKFFKKRYLLLGYGISFWTYILRPVISEFILFPIVGITNEYATYVISAAITAIVFGLFWKRSAVEIISMADIGMQLLKNIFQFISGCIVMLLIIQLGIIIVPRIYYPEWRFYKINLWADVIAFFIFNIIVALKKKFHSYWNVRMMQV